MTELLIILTIILALSLIILVTIQPRQTQIFSMDATSNIGKPSYWQSNTLVKVLTLLILALFVMLLLFMALTFSWSIFFKETMLDFNSEDLKKFKFEEKILRKLLGI